MVEGLPASGPAPDRAERIRLDKWLWHARQAKSRSLAQKMIQAGQVRVNGERVSSNAMAVGPGDVLTLAVHGGTRYADVRLLEIAACGTRRGPYAEALTLYIDRSPPEERAADGGEKAAGAGMMREKRPEARERRLARKLSGKDVS